MTLENVDLDQLILVLASLAAFISVVGLALPLMQSDPLTARLREVGRRREELTEDQRLRLRQTRQRRGTTRVGLMRAILTRLKLQRRTTSRVLRARLAKAGWRGQAAIVTYLFAELLMPLVFGLVTALFVFGMKKLDLSFNAKLLLSIAAAGVGFYLPNVLVANRIQKRQQDLTRAFPDALDLLVLCVEAGLSLDASIARVADDLEQTSPTLAEEFGLTAVELALLGNRRLAFLNLGDRTGVPAFKNMVMALIQAEKYGTSLGTILRILAQENREDRMSRAEEKAGRLPATLTVPMILFFLPVLFVVIIGPAIIQGVRTFQGM